MPEAGEYLFSNVGFAPDEKPYLSLQKDTSFETLFPLGKTITLDFNTSQRYCIGWGDIATGERFTCPDTNKLESKYEQCPTCQRRTGFNPAFYNASSVSEQQETRNLLPHILYLAYFSPQIIKVGISLASRGNSRLLEQGARSALILETFPSAHIARQYEEKIARLPGFAETVLLSKKVSALHIPFDREEAGLRLANAKFEIQKALGVSFDESELYYFDSFFFPEGTPDFTDAFDCMEKHKLSGKVLGQLGTMLFCQQEDTTLFLPLKKFIGYPVVVSYTEEKIELPARQASLF